MREIELFAGTIEHQDTGGDHPTVVLLHAAEVARQSLTTASCRSPQAA
jgi:hypothetical protein